MKRTLIALTVLMTIHLASAQERLAREEALKYALLVSVDLKQLQGTPIPTDVDLKQPVVVYEGDHGGMLLPEAKLTSEAFAKAGDKIVPIGQLWLRKLTPMRDGSALASDKLRVATVRHKDQDVSLAQCALGVRRNRSDALELLVFGKDKEPLVTLPLKRMDAPQELPLDFTAERTGDAGCLNIKILGKYEAKLMVTELEL
jgi:hypothetical protein